MNLKVLANILFHLTTVFILHGCGSDQQDGAAARPGGMGGMDRMAASGSIPVKVDTVKVESISTYILTNTTLEALREVDIIARASGIVEKFNYEEGASVKKGDIIVELDDRELRLAVDQAKAKLDNTQRLFDRSQDMFNKNLISKEMFDDAIYQRETARSQHDNVLLQLEYASIRAPLSGVITKRILEIGDYITTNQIVYTMADYDILLARIFVPEKDIGKIKPGQKTKIEVEAFSNKSFEGIVKMINPVIDPSSGTVKVTVEIERADTGLLPGMFTSVYVLTDLHDNAMVVPKKALILESDTDRLFVFKNGQAFLRDVKVGFTDGNRIEILAGVDADEMVITVGQEGLRDGARVRIIGAPETTLSTEK